MGIRGQYKNKRDLNEPDVFKAIRDEGMMVYPTDKPLDAVVGAYGRTWLVEVKNGPKAPLTRAQAAFFKDWTGHAVVLTSAIHATQWAQTITAEYGGIE